MHANSNNLVGKQFETRKDLKSFGREYNAVFSISNFHLKLGQYTYVCKHGGSRREKDKRLVIDDKEELTDFTDKKHCSAN